MKIPYLELQYSHTSSRYLLRSSVPLQPHQHRREVVVRAWDRTQDDHLTTHNQVPAVKVRRLLLRYKCVLLIALIAHSCAVEADQDYRFTSSGDGEYQLIISKDTYFHITAGDTIAYGFAKLRDTDVTLDNFYHPKIGKIGSLMAPLDRNNISNYPSRIIISQDQNIVYNILK